MSSKAKPRTLPLLPLRDIVVFPHMMVPLYVGRSKSINAVEEAMRGGRELVLAAQRKAKTNEPAPQDIYPHRHGGADHAAHQTAGWHGQSFGGGPPAGAHPRLLAAG